MLISIVSLLDSNIPLLISAQQAAYTNAIAAAPTPITSGSLFTFTPAPHEWMTSRPNPISSQNDR